MPSGNNFAYTSPVNTANPNPSRPSDPRFRSFVERYVIERARLFRADPDGHNEDLWTAMLDAKRAYSLIRRMGQHLETEDL